MRFFRGALTGLVVSFFVSSCGSYVSTSASQYRPLTQEESLQDYRELVSKIQAYYGPLRFKEERFGYKFADVVAEHEKLLLAAKTDSEVFAVYSKLLGKFHDGHVGIAFAANADPIQQYSIPIFLTPVEDKAIVASVDDALKPLGIEVGDEIVSVDGVAPMNIAKVVAQYRSLGNDESDKHFISRALSRPSYMTEIKPTAAEALLEVKKPDGSVNKVKALWRIKKYSEKKLDFVSDRLKGGMYFQGAHEFNEMAQGTLLTMGNVLPFFSTSQVKSKFNMVRVFANEEYLSKFGVNKNAVPEIFAALYRYEGKTILLIRQAGYYPKDHKWSEYMKVYQAILSQYENLADVLVVDQTHNPGGDSEYVEAFFRLFIQEKKGGIVQYMHADRKWIQTFDEWALSLDASLESEKARAAHYRARQVEAAYDAGAWLTPVPLAMNDFDEIQPLDTYTWKKPVLVLTDELAGSCGDIFPMLMQRNKVAKIFGKRTMGLGGNVEEVAELTYSRAEVRMTRGLFTAYNSEGVYKPEELIENNGVKPDVPYEHSLADFRGGYVKYVESFSKEALAQLK